MVISTERMSDRRLNADDWWWSAKRFVDRSRRPAAAGSIGCPRHGSRLRRGGRAAAAYQDVSHPGFPPSETRPRVGLIQARAVDNQRRTRSGTPGAFAST
ncbi:MAG: hypothetical protein V7646_6161, partial [Pseudonocardia sp.]